MRLGICNFVVSMLLISANLSSASEPTDNLIRALDELDLKSFQQLLLEGAPGNGLNKGTPVVLLVVAMNQSQFVRALFEHSKSPVNTNVTLPNGSTALHLAVTAGNSTIVELLLKKGANPALTDASGTRPDQIAAVNNLPGIANILRQKAAANTRTLYSALLKFGYFEYSAIGDVHAQRRALALFEKAFGNSTQLTSHVNADIFERAESLRSLRYSYVYQFVQDGGTHRISSGAGQFGGAQEAFDAAKKSCITEGGRDCSIRIAPLGTCIAVLKPKQLGPYIVSRISTSAEAAVADARSRCLGGQCEEQSSVCVRAD
jgi:hypothetical protein